MCVSVFTDDVVLRKVSREVSSMPYISVVLYEDML